MAKNANFRYPPLKTPTEIHLIRIASSDEAEFRCHLTVIDLNGDPKISPKDENPVSKSTHSETSSNCHFQKYVALSYVWGDQSRLYEIYLDDQPFLVGHSLLVALKSLSRPAIDLATLDPACFEHRIPRVGYPNPPAERYFWIDAISINQSDILEREAQVKLMARIYTQARSVHVELGYDPKENATEFLELIHKINRAGDKCMSDIRKCPTPHQPDVSTTKLDVILGPNDVRTLESYGIPSIKDPIWNNFRRFAQSRYFSRVWILQEYVLPSLVFISLGNTLIGPVLIDRCYVLLNTYSRGKQLYFFPLPKTYDTSWRTDVGGLEFMHYASMRRILFHAPPNSVLSCRFSNFQRLIDLLSYSRVASATDPRDILYSHYALASDTADFTHLVTYSEPTPEVLFLFAKRFIELGQGIELLYNIDSETTTYQGFPSWVPNWNRRMSEPSMIYATKSDATYAASQLVPSDIIVQGATLVVNGGVFDSVVCTTQSVQYAREPPLEAINKFLVQGTLLLCQVRQYPGDQDIEDLLIRTLVFDDKDVHQRNDIGRQRELFRNMINCFAENPRDETWSEHWIRFMHEGFRMAIGRVFCITKNGYFGLVPAGARNGDQVCLFYGGSVPFIIRPLGNGNYRLIGHAYFHGLMHGQAFNLHSFRGQKIVLE